MKMITIEGTIGAGKSSLAELVGTRYDSIVKFESIESELLERWYKETEEERKANRTAFHCQVEFLDRRHQMIMECMLDKKQGFAVLDRSIFTDYVFAKEKYDENEINDTEWYSYNNIRDMALREIDGLEQKAPHLTIYIRVSYETAMKRVNKRARDIEVNADDSMKDWFYKLWKTYDHFMMNEYTHSEVLVIDGDKYDFMESMEDRAAVMEIIHNKLKEVGVIEAEELRAFPSWAKGKQVLVKAKWYNEQGIFGAEVVEVFRSHEGKWILNCKVEGRTNQITLYGEEQYRLLEEYKGV
jgi:deoxyadenosine/deoxycytidine kinase